MGRGRTDRHGWHGTGSGTERFKGKAPWQDDPKTSAEWKFEGHQTRHLYFAAGQRSGSRAGPPVLAHHYPSPPATSPQTSDKACRPACRIHPPASGSHVRGSPQPRALARNLGSCGSVRVPLDFRPGPAPPTVWQTLGCVGQGGAGPWGPCEDVGEGRVGGPSHGRLCASYQPTRILSTRGFGLSPSMPPLSDDVVPD